MEQKIGTLRLKIGLADMLKGGVIMDVVTPEQAKIAEDAGAVAVMSLERVPADIRAAGGVARMADPEIVTKIMDAVAKGELGLASGKQPDGAYGRVWFGEHVSIDDITFDKDVYILTRKKAKQLASGAPEPKPTEPEKPAEPEKPVEPQPDKPGSKNRTVRIAGAIPSEVWNRMSRTVIAKLRNAGDRRQCGFADRPDPHGDVPHHGSYPGTRRITCEPPVR